MRHLVVLFSFALLAASCASSGNTETDAGLPDTGTPDTGTDAGPPDCAEGTHRCGDGCVTDLANEPENGCQNSCGGGDPCDVPEGATAACTLGGDCTYMCEPPLRMGTDGCLCEEGMTCEEQGFECGTQNDGCGGTQNCGTCEDTSTCTDGICVCNEDDAESNETAEAAHSLGASIGDSPPASRMFHYRLSRSDDEDWFTVAVTDECCEGNPDITLSLGDIPEGATYGVAGYYVCDGADITCDAGATDTSGGMHGCTDTPGDGAPTVRLSADCSGIDDGGTLFVRVWALTWAEACQDYELTVAVN